MNKYETLLAVLDKICHDAPTSAKRYHPPSEDKEKMNQARAKALIHLYLKVKFGLLRFEEREHFITDRSGDGGIDAYYIDKERRVVYAIQSKFRTNLDNFEKKNIESQELLSMELGRIVTGEQKSENGSPWNGKIKQFQRELQQTEFHGAFKHKVVLIANCRKLTPAHLKRLCEGFPVEVVDHEHVYEELLFPVVNGTYYKAADLEIKISLSNVSSGQGRVSYTAKTSEFACNVTLVFAPVAEIGRVLAKYRNSILFFNPRSFLGLSKNPVNKEIEKTITEVAGNEFALFNNGITVISDETSYGDSTGQLGVAQLVLRNPQIINGGQTAYSLCRLFERAQRGELTQDIFEGKEVLLKIITIPPSVVPDEISKLLLIEQISRATNLQTQVKEADRRSNEEVQIKLQKYFFSKYGLFYERKAGEFADGLDEQYIKSESVVDREILMRVALAGDLRVSESRRSISKYFSQEAFDQDILDASRFKQYAFGYLCHKELLGIQRSRRRANDKFGTRMFGDALRYGKFAVVAICMKLATGNYEQGVQPVVKQVLGQWKSFEGKAKKLPANGEYFKGTRAPGMVAYYKGKSINADLANYRFI